MGPIQRGTLRFVFVADAPDFSLISKEDINGITVRVALHTLPVTLAAVSLHTNVVVFLAVLGDPFDRVLPPSRICARWLVCSQRVLGSLLHRTPSGR